MIVVFKFRHTQVFSDKPGCVGEPLKFCQNEAFNMSSGLKEQASREQSSDEQLHREQSSDASGSRRVALGTDPKG